VRRLAILALVGVWFGLWFTTGCNRGDIPGNIGKPAPEFTVADGVNSVQLSKLRGRVVILNLWATWCPPCIEELPSLLAMHRELPDIAIVAISEDEDDAVYRKFLAQHQIDLMTVRDPSQRVNRLYGTVQIPETYVIDRRGVLRRKFVSAQDWTDPEIVKYLRSL
jgi:cytochrome c biogenesis protein CcmG/thiol:disulfide interchange protein DsbE